MARLAKKYLTTSQVFQRRLVTATQPTIDPLSSATKQPIGSKESDVRAIAVPAASIKPEVQSCRFFGNAPSSSGFTFLTIDCGNAILLSYPPLVWISVAWTVFSRRHATVIGPTPPGTGVMNPASLLTLSKSTSPRNFHPTRVNHTSTTVAPGLICSGEI